MWCAIYLGDTGLCEAAWSSLKDNPRFKAQNIITAFSSEKTLHRVIGLSNDELAQERLQLLADYARRVLRDKETAQHVKSCFMLFCAQMLRYSGVLDSKCLSTVRALVLR